MSYWHIPSCTGKRTMKHLSWWGYCIVCPTYMLYMELLSFESCLHGSVVRSVNSAVLVVLPYWGWVQFQLEPKNNLGIWNTFHGPVACAMGSMSVWHDFHHQQYVCDWDCEIKSHSSQIIIWVFGTHFMVLSAMPTGICPRQQEYTHASGNMSTWHDFHYQKSMKCGCAYIFTTSSVNSVLFLLSNPFPPHLTKCSSVRKKWKKVHARWASWFQRYLPGTCPDILGNKGTEVPLLSDPLKSQTSSFRRPHLQNHFLYKYVKYSFLRDHNQFRTILYSEVWLGLCQKHWKSV